MSEELQLDGLEQIGFGDSFKEQLCGMLEEIQLFSDFGRKEIELLANYTQAYRAPKGTTVFSEGRRDSYLCILVEGKLDVLKEVDPDTPPKLLTTVRAGKTVGEMSLIDELPHSATVVTRTEAVLLLLTKYHLERINEDHPRLGLKVLLKIAQLLSHRLRQTSGQLIDYLQ